MPRRWRTCRTSSTRWSPRRCCAPASRPSTRSAIRARGPGDLVAVHGVGGLGHLGIQFAAQAGLPHRGGQSRPRQGGARAQARRARLYRQRGRRSRQALRPWAAPRRSSPPSLTARRCRRSPAASGANGTMMVIGAVGPLTVNSLDLLEEERRGAGAGIRVSRAIPKTRSLREDARTSRSMNEIFPLEQGPGGL